MFKKDDLTIQRFEEDGETWIMFDNGRLILLSPSETENLQAELNKPVINDAEFFFDQVSKGNIK